MGHRFQKLVAIGVDLLNVHGGDDETQLTEDDVFCQLLDLIQPQTEQPLGGVLHHARLHRNAHRETGRHIDTDVLMGQGVCEVDIDGHRGQIQVFIRLDDRPDKRRTAVDTLGGTGRAVLVRADLTVDHQHLVGRAAAIPCQNDEQHGEQEQRDHRDRNNDGCGHSIFLL